MSDAKPFVPASAAPASAPPVNPPAAPPSLGGPAPATAPANVQPVKKATPVVAVQAQPARKVAAAAPPSLTPPVAAAPPTAQTMSPPPPATASPSGQLGHSIAPAVLLDSNTLHALLIGDHVHHGVLAEWYANANTKYATCPFTENSLIRTLIRSRHSASEVGWLLVRITSDPRHEFWADQIPYSAVPLTAVVGHRQVTDAYLVQLARHRGSKLLTLDKGLAALHPDVCELLDVADVHA